MAYRVLLTAIGGLEAHRPDYSLGRIKSGPLGANIAELILLGPDHPDLDVIPTATNIVVLNDHAPDPCPVCSVKASKDLILTSLAVDLQEVYCRDVVRFQNVRQGINCTTKRFVAIVELA